MPAPRHVYVTFIRTTPEELWHALTDREMARAIFHGTTVHSDFEPGAAIAYRYPDGRLAVDGEILAADPPRRLTHTWTFRYDQDLAQEPASTITYEIEPMADMCKLTVVHEFPEGGSGAERESTSAGGWWYILSALKTVLETGEPLAAYPLDAA